MTLAKPTRIFYVLAVISGVTVFVLASFLHLGPGLTFFVIVDAGSSLVAIIFGYFWPSQSWRWGLWVLSPFLVMMGLSIAFSGLGPHILKDLSITAVAALVSCAGGILGALLKERRLIF